MRWIIECKNCGVDFPQKSKLNIYCGECYYNGKCEYCDKEFKTKHHNQRFCSHSCSGKGRTRKTTTKTPEEKKQSRLGYDRMRRKKLNDNYIKGCILGKNFKNLEVSQDMIEVRKITIQIHRKIKQLKNETNQHINKL